MSKVVPKVRRDHQSIEAPTVSTVLAEIVSIESVVLRAYGDFHICPQCVADPPPDMKPAPTGILQYSGRGTDTDPNRMMEFLKGLVNGNLRLSQDCPASPGR